MVIAALLSSCHTRVTSGIGFTEEQVAFIQPGVTRRDEVSRQLGYGGLNRPQWQWMHGQAIAYVWQTTNGATGGSFFPMMNGASHRISWVQQTENAYCVVFDEHERVVRMGFFRASESDQLIAVLERWLKVPPGQRQDDSPRPSR